MSTEDDLSKWEARYAADDYKHDTVPVPFLVEATADLPPGRALCLAAGAGRNSVHLAARGWQVTGVDISPRGLARCRQLAADRGVAVATVAADLSTYDMGEAAWDLITMVSFYDPDLFAGICRALRPCGHFLLHTFGPGQLELGWGPRSGDHLAQPEAIRAAFADWEMTRFDHGLYPRADGRQEAVVRALARRPEAQKPGNDEAP